jgi:type II restriction enzyme
MNLRCSPALASGYRSASQIARVVTEGWCIANLYCPSCPCNAIQEEPTNMPGRDLHCGNCRETYQLKSLRQWSSERIVDSAYSAMIRAIRSDTAPGLLVLQYSPEWFVRQLMFVPPFFFSESVIERRNPLAPTARRAGWVGCNIRIGAIPPEGQIFLVRDGAARPPSEVRADVNRVRGFQQIPPSLRGWTLDVLRCVRALDESRFELSDVYAFERELQKLHPDNRNVRPKIRQQLQVLRDIGLVEFEGRGKYRLRSLTSAAKAAG